MPCSMPRLLYSSRRTWVLDMGSLKHAGVLALVDREFVRPGIFPAELSMLLRHAFNQRQKSDYTELITPDEERAREVLDNSRRFLNGVKATLKNLGFPLERI